MLGETPAVRIGKPGRSVTLYRPTDAIRYVNVPSVGGEIYGLSADLAFTRFRGHCYAAGAAARNATSFCSGVR